MSTADDHWPALVGHNLRKTFRRETGQLVEALADVSLEVPRGTLTALVGPDGGGKTTLIRLAAGLMRPDSGQLHVLGIDVQADPQAAQNRLAYMPQRFGLYEDLTVQENLDLYANLHGMSRNERSQRYPELMNMTGLGPFTTRFAGRLSGGMKQKLGLACTLISSPELLLLDEPTVGVDPLSRKELWEIILGLVHNQGLTVLLSTSYLGEAERCAGAVILYLGRVLASGPPTDITNLAQGRAFLAEPPAGEKARNLQVSLLDDPRVVDAVPEAGQVRFVEAGPVPPRQIVGQLATSVEATPPRFEDGFMIVLRSSAEREAEAAGSMKLEHPPPSQGTRTAVKVDNLVRRFGDFTAVDHVSFHVDRGEIFGLLGPNGAGKTTTFRMLCGLLPATSGTLEVAGVDLHRARASARQRIGYVAQKFSLYMQLSVIENLQFFASAYGLHGRRRKQRVDWAMKQFELASFARLPSGELPGGFKQRLAMAASLLHEPEILFLDEPTSGADPLARREFWRRITALADQGVTIIVTTHFMEEAEYCDRIVVMDAGRVLAEGTPAEVRARGTLVPGRVPTMDDAFIAIVEQARRDQSAGATSGAGK